MAVNRSAGYIFKTVQISFEAGIFVDKLKMAVVKPLYKKRNREDFENYRSISLLTVF
jgi:hypothetical protein